MRKFSDWLREEINDRNWTQAKLAQKSSVPAATISRIINETRDPGVEVCKKLAKGLGYPPEFVLRKAGKLPPKRENEDPRLIEANRLLSELPEEYRGQALQLIRFLHANHVGPDPDRAKSTSSSS